jgi:hypothetical protein
MTTEIPIRSADRSEGHTVAVAVADNTRLRIAGRLTAALAVAVLVAAGGTLAVPGVLRGTPVMNGSARGTATVMLAVTLPVLLAAAALARRGSARAHVVWLGAAGHLTYNGVLLLLATPMNRLFLVYTTSVGLAIATVVAVAAAVDVRDLAARFSPATPARGVAAYLGVVVALNTFLWLSDVVPATVEGDTSFLDGTGLTTNPIYAQDLAVWLPLAGLAAWWLWHRRPWGYLAGGAMLVTWVIEAVSVATDQWLGGSADPSSSVASTSMTLPFAVLAVVGLVPTLLLLRHVDEHVDEHVDDGTR